MEPFTEQTLRRLAAIENTPCVSVFLSARGTGAHAENDTTRLKHLLSSAEAQIATAAPDHDPATLLAPLHALIDDFDFWKDWKNGLALFVAPGMAETYRVPVELQDTVTVADHFNLLPLLPLGTSVGTFFLLTLSQNHVRLFSGTRTDLDEIDLPETVTSLEAFLRQDQFQEEAQMHSGNAPMHGGRTKENAVFHGTGSVRERTKEDLSAFAHALDRAVLAIRGVTEGPLVLAGVDFLQAIYRNQSRHPHVMESGIAGSPDRTGMKDLHQAAWEIASSYFDHDRQSAMKKLDALRGTGLTSDDADEILAAAREGRVEALLVATPGIGVNGNDGTDMKTMAQIRSVIATAGKIFPVVDGILPGTSASAIMRY
jgi:hypothetical protein